MAVKVFHIISHIAMGGAERVAINIATDASADAEYHVVEVLRGQDAVTDTLLAELSAAGVYVHRSCIAHSKLGILLFPLRFLGLMLRYRADVIHTHTEVPDLSVYLWHRLFGWLFHRVRFVRTIHNTELWTGWKSIGKRVEAFFQSRHANVAIGRGTAESYRRDYGESAPVIPNGVQELPQAPFPGLVEGARNILFAGRMEPQKGIATLIRTVQQLAEHMDIVFHIIGTGSMREEAERELGGLPTVRLYDRMPSLASRLGGVETVFMPSEFEGLVLFSLEATLAGVPVLANRCPGLEETLPPDWPLMAEGNDTDTYVRLLTAPRSAEERAALAAHAQDYVREHYSFAAMRSGYLRLYTAQAEKE